MYNCIQFIVLIILELIILNYLKMSSENVSSETYGGSLEDEQYREIEQEEQFWGGEQVEQLGEELDKHWSISDIYSYETITNEEIDYSKEEKQIKLTGQIKLIEDLRLKQSELRRRKARALLTLTELIEKGLVSYVDICGLI